MLIHCLKSNKLIQFQRSETLMVSLFLQIDTGKWLCEIFLCIYICLFNDLCLLIHLTASFYFPLMLINNWWIKLNICTFYLFNVRKRKKQCTKEKLFKKSWNANEFISVKKVKQNKYANMSKWASFFFFENLLVKFRYIYWSWNIIYQYCSYFKDKLTYIPTVIKLWKKHILIYIYLCIHSHTNH